MDGIFMLGIPGETMKVIAMIAKKTSKTHADIIADGIAMMAKKHLTPEDVAKKSG